MQNKLCEWGGKIQKRETWTKQMLVVVKSYAMALTGENRTVRQCTRSLKQPPSYQSSPPLVLRQLFLFFPPILYTHTHSPIASPDLCLDERLEEGGYTILKPSWSIRTRNNTRIVIRILKSQARNSCAH